MKSEKLFFLQERKEILEKDKAGRGERIQMKREQESEINRTDLRQRERGTKRERELKTRKTEIYYEKPHRVNYNQQNKTKKSSK